MENESIERTEVIKTSALISNSWDIIFGEGLKCKRWK